MIIKLYQGIVKEIQKTNHFSEKSRTFSYHYHFKIHLKW